MPAPPEELAFGPGSQVQIAGATPFVDTNSANPGAGGWGTKWHVPIVATLVGQLDASGNFSFPASQTAAIQPNVFKPQNAVAVNPVATVWTPAAGKKFRLIAVQLMADTLGLYQFNDGVGGSVIFSIALGPANTALPLVQISNVGILSAAANNVLQCLGPGGSHLTGQLYGTEE